MLENIKDIWRVVLSKMSNVVFQRTIHRRCSFCGSLKAWNNGSNTVFGAFSRFPLYGNQAGNEADVSLYLSSNGLMWENAKSFNALLVFAEHRFYGESLPFGTPDKGREYLRRVARMVMPRGDLSRSFAKSQTSTKPGLGIWS